MSKQKYPQTSTSTLSDGSVAKRKGRDSYSSAKLHAKRDRKRREAYARQDAYDRLSNTAKLRSLGKTGSKRQRVRLEALIAAGNP